MRPRRTLPSTVRFLRIELIKSYRIEQGLALAHISRLGLPAEIAYADGYTALLIEVIHPVLYSLHSRVAEIAYQLAVLDTDRRLADSIYQSELEPPAVDAVLLVLSVNVALKHLLEGIPCPLAVLIEHSGVLKTCLGNGLSVVDHCYGVACCLNACHIVLAVPDELVIYVLYVLPEGRIEVDIIIYGHEHLLDGASWECVKVAPVEKVYALI